jgi:hypothetical protein
MILGVWLIVAPFMLGYSTGQVILMSNDAMLGFLLIASSLWVLVERANQVGVSAFEFACGHG